MYEVVDRKTGNRVGLYKNRNNAFSAILRLDFANGGTRYFYREIV